MSRLLAPQRGPAPLAPGSIAAWLTQTGMSSLPSATSSFGELPRN